MPDSRLTDFLSHQKIPFSPDTQLRKLTSFQIGGKAAYLVEPETIEQCAALQHFLIHSGIAWFLLAGGSNVLIGDGKFEGVVVKLNLATQPEMLEVNTHSALVRATANTRAPAFARTMSSLGYTGLEFLTTIPGELGGSVIQNAGCYGFELKDSITCVTTCIDGKVKSLSNEQCEFSYRNSIFKGKPGYWVLQADFSLARGQTPEIEARIAEYRDRRISSQPKNRKSAGSIFKNPAGLKAWELIERAGLRGLKHGGAEISAEHCNFIVNNGNATAADVLYLIQLIEKEVAAKCGIQLEREVVLLGNFTN